MLSLRPGKSLGSASSRRLSLLALASLTLAIAACGDDESAEGSGGSASSANGSGGDASPNGSGGGGPATTSSSSGQSTGAGGEGATGGGGGAGGGEGGGEPADLQPSRVATGAMHSCAIGESGTLRCFGWNILGQVGDGTTDDAPDPVEAGSGLTFASVAAGGAFTCALTGEGERWCWGNAGYGQLGDGTEQDVLTPKHVDGGWRAITAGLSHACGIRDDGAAYCWGNNDYGAVGSGPADDILTPLQIPANGETFRSISADQWMTCGVTDSGKVVCWGVFYGDLLEATPPTVMGSDEDWASIDVGYRNVCAIKQDGTLWCNGDNSMGGLGQGDLGLGSDAFLQVGTATDWAHVSVGADQACAIDTSNDLYCWGRNVEGEVGVPIKATTAAVTTPTQVGAGRNWVDVSAGGSQYSPSYSSHTCALDADGTVACWGSSGLGQLGNGEHYQSSYGLERIGDDDDWSEIDAAGLMRKTDGSVWKLGDLGYGGLDFDNSSSEFGIPSTSLIDLDFVAAPGSLAGGYALDDEGTIFYGYAREEEDHPLYQLWVVPFVMEPLDVGSGYVQTAAGRFHVCAIQDEGALFCWGSNFYGQLGDGTTDPSDEPVEVMPGSAWTALAIGDTHTCAVRDDGTLWCWGSGTQGVLGTGSTDDTPSPAQVGTDEDWAAVTAGWSSTCALKVSGALFCWGDELDIGNGGAGSLTPVAIGTGTYRKIHSTYSHTCGIQTDGTMWCWGFGLSGEVGDSDGSTPTRIGDDDDWEDVAASAGSSFGVRAGEVWSWGYAGYSLHDEPVDIDVP